LHWARGSNLSFFFVFPSSCRRVFCFTPLSDCLFSFGLEPLSACGRNVFQYRTLRRRRQSGAFTPFGSLKSMPKPLQNQRCYPLQLHCLVRGPFLFSPRRQPPDFSDGWPSYFLKKSVLLGFFFCWAGIVRCPHYASALISFFEPLPFNCFFAFVGPSNASRFPPAVLFFWNQSPLGVVKPL